MYKGYKSNKKERKKDIYIRVKERIVIVLRFKSLVIECGEKKVEATD